MEIELTRDEAVALLNKRLAKAARDTHELTRLRDRNDERVKGFQKYLDDCQSLFDIIVKHTHP